MTTSIGTVYHSPDCDCDRCHTDDDDDFDDDPTLPMITTGIRPVCPPFPVEAEDQSHTLTYLEAAEATEGKR